MDIIGGENFMVKLDTFSQRFAQALFAEFPQWQQFARGEAPEFSNTNDGDSLVVKVPSPVTVKSPEFGNWLLIDTFGEEVTISYDYYHAHFGFPADNDVYECSGLNDPIGFLRDFVNEDISIVVFTDGDNCRASHTLERGDEVDLVPCSSRAVASMSSAEQGDEVGLVPFALAADRAYVRSWNGSYDQAISYDG